MLTFKVVGSLILLFLPAFALPVAADEDEQRLFVNLTSDELDRAAMAIGFGTKVLQEKKIPVTIFLNVDGVRLADKNIPQNKYVTGNTPQQMLQKFMESGGRVIICPMCMKNVGGMGKDDLIEGVEMGGPQVTWPALFDEYVTVLSY